MDWAYGFVEASVMLLWEQYPQYVAGGIIGMVILIYLRMCFYKHKLRKEKLEVQRLHNYGAGLEKKNETLCDDIDALNAKSQKEIDILNEKIYALNAKSQKEVVELKDQFERQKKQHVGYINTERAISHLDEVFNSVVFAVDKAFSFEVQYDIFVRYIRKVGEVTRSYEANDFCFTTPKYESSYNLHLAREFEIEAMGLERLEALKQDEIKKFISLIRDGKNLNDNFKEIYDFGFNVGFREGKDCTDEMILPSGNNPLEIILMAKENKAKFTDVFDFARQAGFIHAKQNPDPEVVMDQLNEPSDPEESSSEEVNQEDLTEEPQEGEEEREGSSPNEIVVES